MSRAHSSASEGEGGHQRAPVTTMMLRNVPRNYSRSLLAQELDDLGFANKYNMLRLPVEKRKHTNVGYAFVNLCSEQEAQQFLTTLSGHYFQNCSGQKAASVCPAHMQYPDRKQRHFESAREAHQTRDIPKQGGKEREFCSLRLTAAHKHDSRSCESDGSIASTSSTLSTPMRATANSVPTSESAIQVGEKDADVQTCPPMESPAPANPAVCLSDPRNGEGDQCAQRQLEWATKMLAQWSYQMRTSTASTDTTKSYGAGQRMPGVCPTLSSRLATTQGDVGSGVGVDQLLRLKEQLAERLREPAYEQMRGPTLERSCASQATAFLKNGLAYVASPMLSAGCAAAHAL